MVNLLSTSSDGWSRRTMDKRKKLQGCFTRNRGDLIYQIFEPTGPPRPSKDNQTPSPHILILLTPQGGRGPPVLPSALEYMGMVLDCPCLALEAQLIQKTINKPTTMVWAETWSKSIRLDSNNLTIAFPRTGDRPRDRKLGFRGPGPN